MTAEHERALLVRGLVPSAPVEVPWRTHGVVLRVVFFALTCIALAALHFFFDLVGIPKEGLLTGAIAIAVAEFLIGARRWFWTGIEEALWIGGTFALITTLPRSGTPESNLVLAAAAAIPGYRVRNPLFGALAATFVVTWFEERFDLGVASALVVGLIAAFALLRTWRRPSTEWLWIALLVIVPASGYFHADEVWRNVTIILYAALGLVALTLAITRRHHALFLGGGIALAIASIELGRLVATPLEAKLAAGGALLLAGSWIVARALRGRTRGIVATSAKLTPYDDELELLATVHIPQPEFDAAREQGGGEFGGAGATGKY